MRPGPDGGGAAAGRRACRCSVLREMACSSRTISCCAFEMAASSLALVASKVSITSDISLSFWKSSWYLLQGGGGRANGKPWRRSGSQWRWRWRAWRWRRRMRRRRRCCRGHAAVSASHFCFLGSLASTRSVSRLESLLRPERTASCSSTIWRSASAISALSALTFCSSISFCCGRLSCGPSSSSLSSWCCRCSRPISSRMLYLVARRGRGGGAGVRVTLAVKGGGGGGDDDGGGQGGVAPAEVAEAGSVHAPPRRVLRHRLLHLGAPLAEVVEVGLLLRQLVHLQAVGRGPRHSFVGVGRKRATEATSKPGRRSAGIRRSGLSPCWRRGASSPRAQKRGCLQPAAAP